MTEGSCFFEEKREEKRACKEEEERRPVLRKKFDSQTTDNPLVSYSSTIRLECVG